MIGHIVLRKILMPCVVMKHTRNQNGVLQPLLSAYSGELCNDKDNVSLAVPSIHIKVSVDTLVTGISLQSSVSLPWVPEVNFFLSPDRR